MSPTPTFEELRAQILDNIRNMTGFGFNPETGHCVYNGPTPCLVGQLLSPEDRDDAELHMATVDQLTGPSGPLADLHLFTDFLRLVQSRHDRLADEYNGEWNEERRAKLLAQVEGVPQ